MFVLIERPPVSTLALLRHGLSVLAGIWTHVNDACTTPAQVSEGADSPARRVAESFDQYLAGTYFQLSAEAATDWLRNSVVDLVVEIYRTGKAITGDEWIQYLKSIGEQLVGNWLAIMQEETPVLLRAIVNRAEFQRKHVSYLQNTIAESWAPPVPLPIVSFAPDPVPTGLAAVVAQATPLYRRLSPARASSSSPISNPFPTDLRSTAEKRRDYVIQRRNQKKWRNNQDWAEAIRKQHPDEPISARTLDNYLNGRTKPTRTTRKLMAESLNVLETELPL